MYHVVGVQGLFDSGDVGGHYFRKGQSNKANGIIKASNAPSKLLWGDFLSFYSWFYEVTILESTYATSEGKNAKCISRC